MEYIKGSWYKMTDNSKDFYRKCESVDKQKDLMWYNERIEWGDYIINSKITSFHGLDRLKETTFAEVSKFLPKHKLNYEIF